MFVIISRSNDSSWPTGTLASLRPVSQIRVQASQKTSFSCFQYVFSIITTNEMQTSSWAHNNTILLQSCSVAANFAFRNITSYFWFSFIFLTWSVWADKPWQCSPHCHLGSGLVSDCADSTRPGLHFGISSSDRLIREDWLPPPHVRKVTAAHQVPKHVGKIDEVSWRWIVPEPLLVLARFFFFFPITSPGGRLM